MKDFLPHFQDTGLGTGFTGIVALCGASKTTVMLWVGESQLSEANIFT